jgi:hypothetical protein
MDGAEPIIRVCSTCRDREVFGAAAGLSPIPFRDWPVSLDRLLLEDAARLRHLRAEPVGEAIAIKERHERANRLR